MTKDSAASREVVQPEGVGGSAVVALDAAAAIVRNWPIGEPQ